MPGKPKPKRGRPKQNTHATYLSLYQKDKDGLAWLAENTKYVDSSSAMVRVLIREELDRRGYQPQPEKRQSDE